MNGALLGPVGSAIVSGLGSTCVHWCIPVQDRDRRCLCDVSCVCVTCCVSVMCRVCDMLCVCDMTCVYVMCVTV